ncbi:hypothetical protein A4A49_58844, partial [Nicotiana attenuata]
FYRHRIHVHIVDGIQANSPQLSFHCQSDDDDLGYHYPTLNQEFQFDFKLRVFAVTLFYCHFWWGTKQAMFDVFRVDGACSVYGGLDTKQCYWLIKEDGFYFANQEHPSPSSLFKLHDWA